MMAVSLTNSRLLKEIQNLVVCDACKKANNEPKTLSCSHSFCKACLENLVTQDKDNADGEGKKLDCPTCGSKTSLKPNENVAGLPDNEFAIKLLTVVGPNRNQEASVCSYCQKEPCIAICMECEMLLCHKHLVKHERWPANINHILLSLSEIINRDELQQVGAEALSCTRCKDTKPKFYCETCKELICMKCVATVHKKPGHTCVALHEIYQKQQEAVKTKSVTINAMLLEGEKALETVNNSKGTYEKTAQDIKEKHTAQKDEMMETVTDSINKILADKLEEVKKVYDPACQKLSVQAETVSNYVQKVEKSLQRTNDVLEKSKLEELLSAQKVIDDDIQTLQNEKPPNLTTFQVQVENPQSCSKQLSFYTMFKELAFRSFIADTEILKTENELRQHFLCLLNNRKSPLRLCYRASLHGWSCQQFHKLCDDKAETVVLVKVGNWIFGGYTDKTWQGLGQYKSSNASFLFSLRNPNNMQPFKCPIINGTNGCAIYCGPSYGASFGGGHDLYIRDNANSNTNSYSNLGHTYQPPSGHQYGTQQTQSLFAGSYNFTPTEVEVFY